MTTNTITSGEKGCVVWLILYHPLKTVYIVHHEFASFPLRKISISYREIMFCVYISADAILISKMFNMFNT